jgi:Outer membrane protein beta-barrel domain
VRAPVYKAAPVIISDWAGFYLGVNGGGGWANYTFDYATPANGTGSGGLVGGHAGYNWQYGNAVAGMEVDFDGADLKNTDVYGLQHKTDELASARARLGYVVIPLCSPMVRPVPAGATARSLRRALLATPSTSLAGLLAPVLNTSYSDR